MVLSAQAVFPNGGGKTENYQSRLEYENNLTSDLNVHGAAALVGRSGFKSLVLPNMSPAGMVGNTSVLDVMWIDSDQITSNPIIQL